MLRIDETSNTLVAPQQGGFEPEAPLERTELLTLICSGWTPFAHELGRTHLRLLAIEPQPGVDLLGFDDASGRVVVMVVADRQEDPGALLGRSLLAASHVAALNAPDLEAVHEALAAAVPGETPEIVLLGSGFEPDVTLAMDWLVRRHSFDLTAHQVQVMRFGSERLLEVSQAYPAAPAEPAVALGQQFFADVMAPPAPEVAANSAPPPGAAPPPVPPAVEA